MNGASHGDASKDNHDILNGASSGDHDQNAAMKAGFVNGSVSHCYNTRTDSISRRSGDSYLLDLVGAHFQYSDHLESKSISVAEAARFSACLN
jgi:hypothetical protein